MIRAAALILACGTATATAQTDGTFKATDALAQCLAAAGGGTRDIRSAHDVGQAVTAADRYGWAPSLLGGGKHRLDFKGADFGVSIEVQTVQEDGSAYCIVFGPAMQPGDAAAAIDRILARGTLGGQPVQTPTPGPGTTRRFTWMGLPHQIDLVAYAVPRAGEVAGVIVTGLPAPTPAAPPTQAPRLADQDPAIARAAMAIGIATCVSTMPNVAATRAALGAAGYTYSAERLSAQEVIHWYDAQGSVRIGISEGQMAPDCRITTSIMGVTEAVRFTGEVLNRSFPGVFSYGRLDNAPPVTAANRGTRRDWCTGYISGAGARFITLSVGNAGNDPACIEDGTSQILIVN